ncbi:MAG: hypothetical protein FJW31_23020 [Acidobacteria bacterium]|nr:hypothetical protein [Acidobacteriota bacterium]
MNLAHALRLGLLGAAACILAPLEAQPAFNIDTGNAAIEVVIPTVAPIIFTDISPSGSDATLVLRFTTMITNAWFDSTAPYHPTAVGIYSRLGRRPSDQATNRNLNTALLYGSFRVLNSLAPHRAAEWRGMLTSAGFNPDDGSENFATATGLGNRAGRAIVAFRERNGMNQLGDEGGHRYHRHPYADYTGYEPVNTAYDLRDPSRWQPQIITNGFGLFRVQQFVTPQFARTRPYAYNNPNQFNVRPPLASNPRGNNRSAYQAQADEVIRVSVSLNDHQKIVAELFNDKIRSLGFSAVFAAQSRGLSLLDFIHLDFFTNMAAFNAGIAAW